MFGGMGALPVPEFLKNRQQPIPQGAPAYGNFLDQED
jgi:hypothetical protein